MLAVRAGESSPTADYTAQHRLTARSFRRCAAPSLPALSWPGHPWRHAGQACCGRDGSEIIGPASSCTAIQPITMNGSLLTLERNHFCAKARSAMLNV
jgi:hypothetical protein